MLRSSRAPRAAWLGAAALLTLVAHAACSSEPDALPPPGLGGSSGASGASNGGLGDGGASGGASSGVPSTGSFTSGESFDPEKLGDLASPMVLGLYESSFYTRDKSKGRAIAINRRGLGYVAVRAGIGNEEAEDLAVEGCFFLGGGEPCALLASGDEFAVSSANLANEFYRTLEQPTTVSQIPFVQGRTPDASNQTSRDHLANAFAAALAPRALAVSADGSWSLVSGPAEGGVGYEEVQRLALQRCELSATMVPCTLFAGMNSGPNDEETILFDRTKSNGVEAFDYTRTDLQSLPGVAPAAMTQAEVAGCPSNSEDGFPTGAGCNNLTAYQNGLGGSVHGKLFVSNTGKFGWAHWVDPTSGEQAGLTEGEAIVLAQQRCARGGGTCMHYANDMQKVFTAAQLPAMRDNAAAHCRSMPRQGCANHLVMGCKTSGSYYTFTSGKPDVEQCTF